MNRKTFLQLIALFNLTWLIPPRIKANAIAESWPSAFDVEAWKPPAAIYPLQSKDALKFHKLKMDYLRMLDEFDRGIDADQQAHLDFLQSSIDFWEFNHIKYGHLKTTTTA